MRTGQCTCQPYWTGRACQTFSPGKVWSKTHLVFHSLSHSSLCFTVFFNIPVLLGMSLERPKKEESWSQSGNTLLFVMDGCFIAFTCDHIDESATTLPYTMHNFFHSFPPLRYAHLRISSAATFVLCWHVHT